MEITIPEDVVGVIEGGRGDVLHVAVEGVEHQRSLTKDIITSLSQDISQPRWMKIIRTRRGRPSWGG